MAVLGLVPLGYWLCLAWRRLGLAINLLGLGYGCLATGCAWFGAAWVWLWLCSAWCRLAINGYGLAPLGYWLCLVPLGYWLCLAWHRLGLAVNGYGLAIAAWLWLCLAPLGLGYGRLIWLLMAMAWCRLAMAVLVWRRLAWHRLGLAVNGYGLAIAVWLWPLAKNIKREPLSRERDKVVLRITGSMQSLEPPLSPPSLKCIILLLVERGRDSNNRVPFTYCTFSSLASIKYYSL